MTGAKEVSIEIRDKTKKVLIKSFLEEKKYLAGDSASIADISTLTSIIMLQFIYGNIGNHSNIKTWLSRCEKLLGFEENMTVGKNILGVFQAMGITIAPLE